MPRLLSVDPSICDLGWAVFYWTGHTMDDSGEVSKQGRARLLVSGHIRNKSFTDEFLDTIDPAAWAIWVHSLDVMAKNVFRLAHEEGVSEAIIEMPEVWGGSKRGIAANNSGAIMKLTAFVFTLREALSFGGIPVYLVPVRVWKGQQPKSITKKRVSKHWGWLGTNHNECDAVGIGGWFLRNERKLVADVAVLEDTQSRQRVPVPVPVLRDFTCSNLNGSGTSIPLLPGVKHNPEVQDVGEASDNQEEEEAS